MNMSLVNIQHILESAGLAEKEALLYLTNLKIGTNLLSIIAKEANVQRSTAYPLIEKLKKKGYLMEFKKGNLKYYTAVEPRRILNYMKYRQSEAETKIREFADNILSLETLKTAYHSRPIINLLEGKNTIIYVYETMLAEEKPIKTILSSSIINGKIKDYFISYTQRRIFKKIPVKILTDEKTLDTAAELIRKEFCQIRFFENKIFPNSIVNLYGNKTAIVSTENEFVILIEDKCVTEILSGLFDLIWDGFSKKNPRFY